MLFGGNSVNASFSLTGWMHGGGEGVGEKTESDGCLKGEYKGTDVSSEKM